jgi:quinol monooxygenase YgiN
MLTVIATFVAKPGREAEVRRELLKLVEPTRREDGCINYDLHQKQGDPATFVFYENWRDRAALDAHAQSPHICAWRDYQAREEPLAKDGHIEFLDMLSKPVHF